MPTPEEQKTAQDLRDAGLTQRAAEVLAAKLETTAQASRDSAFRDFRAELNAKFDALHAEIAEVKVQVTSLDSSLRAEIASLDSDLRAPIAATKADSEKSLRQMQRVLLTAILGTGSIIVAVSVALKFW